MIQTRKGDTFYTSPVFHMHVWPTADHDSECLVLLLHHTSYSTVSRPSGCQTLCTTVFNLQMAKLRPEYLSNLTKTIHQLTGGRLKIQTQVSLTSKCLFCRGTLTLTIPFPTCSFSAHGSTFPAVSSLQIPGLAFSTSDLPAMTGFPSAKSLLSLLPVSRGTLYLFKPEVTCFSAHFYEQV